MIRWRTDDPECGVLLRGGEGVPGFVGGLRGWAALRVGCGEEYAESTGEYITNVIRYVSG